MTNDKSLNEVLSATIFEVGSAQELTLGAGGFFKEPGDTIRPTGRWPQE